LRRRGRERIIEVIIGWNIDDFAHPAVAKRGWCAVAGGRAVKILIDIVNQENAMTTVVE
jgi:hypothetical protein